MRTMVGLLCAVVSIAAFGCGSDDSDSDSDSASESEPTAQEAKEADNSAKTAVRNLAAAMEVCYVDSASYAGCDLATAKTIEPSLSEGDVAVKDTAAATYTIEARSTSGTTFQIGKAGDGATERTCKPSGSGGCPADGLW